MKNKPWKMTRSRPRPRWTPHHWLTWTLVLWRSSPSSLAWWRCSDPAWSPRTTGGPSVTSCGTCSL
ncbi:hypothetical protein DPMN_059089 [Dreissena polymorpha]|uniref:Uncharacterized protein n=1 Tax=Dreissena polymorpha TaxID=45954 RepID=A0A9D4C3F6_DREPO|nr:hypothetical protein DPMN_059089 [Dreissena polymorpha]